MIESMSTNGETADQMMRMSMQGIEMAASVALKAGGAASKSLAVTLYAILTDKKKVKGKTRLNAMLKSGKELKVFAIKHEDLQTFCKEAKHYGVLYCVLKEKDKTDGICDIMVRAEDASKISRIVDKFELATVDTQAIRDSINSRKNMNEQFKNTPILSEEEHDKIVEELLNSIRKEEKTQSQNPTMARTKKRDENQFEHISKDVKKKSVRKGLNELKKVQSQKSKDNILQKESQKIKQNEK